MQSSKLILSVSEINKYIKDVISRDVILSNLMVKGEISNYKAHYSGHMYFTLKDGNSVIKCVMFRTNASVLKFVPENGMKVIIKGYVSIFERDGQYQLYAEEMQPDGIGSLHIAFEQLKRKLESEGIFDAVHKKRIPFLPASIAVVTSSTGSVIRDIINVLSRRFPNVNLKIFPVAVQGEHAAGQIANALRVISKKELADVIIIARGGGSIEELWAFNEEIVARSIFECRIPVISAVGHETDFTISDFAADLRAPTPSAAAEMVVPEKNMLCERVLSLRKRLRNGLLNNLGKRREKLKSILKSSAFRQPYGRIYQERMKLDIIYKDIYNCFSVCRENKRANLSIAMAKLNALSPLTILCRGYSAVKSKKDGTLIKSVLNVMQGDSIELQMSDGKIDCTIEKVDYSGK